MNDDIVEDELYLLAKRPSSTILTFQGYEINGNTFYTIAQDKKSTNQNSGVRFDDAANTNREKDTYYGYIEEIWELDYGSDLKVPLFRCKWVNLTGGGVMVDPQYGMTTVDLNNLGYIEEPFVLANDVARVFYVKDMSTKPIKRKDKKVDTSYDVPKRHIVVLRVHILSAYCRDVYQENSGEVLPKFCVGSGAEHGKTNPIYTYSGGIRTYLYLLACRLHGRNKTDKLY